MAEDVECRRWGQAVRQTVRVDTPEGYRRLCLPCFEVLGDWINGTGAELACPVWSCRERFHSHHDETAATSLLYHLEAEHEWLIDFLSGKLGGAELRTDGGIESSGSDRTLLDELARIEHKQWWEWSNSIAQSEDLSDERLDRWREFWVPYHELPEDVKEHDRKWAREVLELLHRYDVLDLGGLDLDHELSTASDRAGEGQP